MVRRIVAVVGATATGKTALGERLAAAIGGEVVCADARQVYRELEIGTGKPSPAERLARPHHLFDALGLGERASAGWFARVAAVACEGVLARGRVPVLVGGSGLYLSALRHGFHGAPSRDAAVRVRLDAEAAGAGVAEMHERLRRADPETAERLDSRDRQRVLRALEVVEVSGRTMAWWRTQPREGALAGDWRAIELTCAPDELERRIVARTRRMLADGLVEETRALLRAGHADALAALRAIGYDEAAAHLSGGLDESGMVAAIDRRTRQLAKRQRTWFRHQVDAIRIASDDPAEPDPLRAALAVLAD